MKNTLLNVLSPNAQSRNLTAQKTDFILNNTTEYHLTGFVVTDVNGNIGIIDKSAVRWIKKEDFWKLMHSS